ncbi:ParB/RepB/Spo0J family partition protein [Microvirga pudoricolor]|uniref:ParB/RepB/Spo0J family partition protein n=1 Tax=Microvirga pudoricolor TaxID=2778729 RepID=UPI00195145B0|nr:ParB/RepB/Spo0J family partition protein [Microvirga pudoricolor]MBM6595410.1 ParB/RepB/Spo0J family partition protein [Microvirga pudoricolor]
MTATTIIQTIPLTKLVASKQNVRRTNVTAGLDELCASIAAHGLLQSLSVMPVVDGDGAETGKYHVIGGGRRLAALKRLAKEKRIPKAFEVPCLIAQGEAEELSLVENVVRERLHPADEYEAFKKLQDEQGLSVDDIAARFGVTPRVVQQRLRLGAVSPRLMKAYREEELTLEQLMAFAVTDDQERQEQVYGRLVGGYNMEAYTIRRMLTEGHVPASDKRVRFVGVEAYEAAGGTVVRDLFSDRDGIYCEDVALLDRLVDAKLTEAAVQIGQEEGWKWVEPQLEFPHGNRMRRIQRKPVALSEEDQAAQEMVQAEYNELSEQYEGAEELPDAVDLRMSELEALIESFEEKGFAYDAQDCKRAGVIVCLDYDGNLRIERGYVRPEDEVSQERPARGEGIGEEDADGEGDAPEADEQDEPEDEGMKPLSDRLVGELTAHRTQALRLTLGENPDVALIAVVHAMASRLFYSYADASVLDLKPLTGYLASHADGIADTKAARIVSDRHEAWKKQLPEKAPDLWTFVAGLDHDSLMSLLAHCAGQTVMAVQQPHDRSRTTTKNADVLAEALALDMTQWWEPTASTYFGRVAKPRIAQAVEEAVSAAAAENLATMKKQAMAEAAQKRVAGTGWLPAILRTRGVETMSQREERFPMAAE